MTNKQFECTNLHGIVRLDVSDTGIELVMIYDSGDKYKQFVSFPHREKGYPALRGRWSFQTKM